ncbi:hypothetical protein [Pedobacter nutrimenti]|uniref:hypothetical protein n=1 Tax=Pedobacter nutrimenti TaxID=1241337 RepID=UPI0029313E74|nr:hypothetical protein [Pedobacter nutrimenti]
MNNDTWILKYWPLHGAAPVFLLWYTDTDKENTDKLFTFKTGEIFATHSLNDLKATIIQNFDAINEFENLKSWLNDFENLDLSEVTVYDMPKMYAAVKAREFEMETLEDLTNFINLFGDYVHQIDSNKYLMPLAYNKYLRKAWDYFYDSVFWPRFNDKDRFETWERPPFKVNAVKLTQGLEELIESFEGNMIVLN